MASISKSGTPSISTAVPGTEHNISGLIAGETIAAGDACYIKTSDGKIWRSIGTSANAAAVVDGFAPDNYSAGDGVSLYWGINFNYGASLSPGTFLYLDTVAGGLSDATTTGGTTAIARVIDATRIFVKKSY